MSLLKKQYCRRTIYRWVCDGMPHKRIRSRLWFPKEEAIAWILGEDSKVEVPSKTESTKKTKPIKPKTEPLPKVENKVRKKSRKQVEKLNQLALETDLAKLSQIKKINKTSMDDVEVICCDILSKIRTERLDSFEEDKELD